MCFQMAGNNLLIPGSCFQAAFCLCRYTFAVWQSNKPVRAMPDIKLTQKCTAVAVNPAGCAFLFQNQSYQLVIKMVSDISALQL